MSAAPQGDLARAYERIAELEDELDTYGHVDDIDPLRQSVADLWRAIARRRERGWRGPNGPAARRARRVARVIGNPL